MIKANELRLGNLVFKEGVIHPIGFYDFENNGSNFIIDEYKPIPLTEEILLKCTERNYRYGYDGLMFEFYVVKYFFLSICKTNNGKLFTLDIGEEQIELKYIHQLQNLYFALTGEELKIEL